MKNKITTSIYDNIKKTVKVTNAGLHEPYFDNFDLSYVKNAILSTYVSTYGKQIQLFEKKLAKLFKSKYIVCLNSGTSALHIALKLVGVKKNSEVIMPSLSYVAPANAIKYNGARPYFIDCDISNYGMCPKSLENTLKKIIKFKKKIPYNKISGRIVSAILPVHVFGFAVEMDKILKIAKRYNIPVVEDAADSFGTKFKKKYTGTFGSAGIFSFNGNKTITTGSGGAIATNNKKLYLAAIHLVSIAKKRHKWKFYHDQIGWNYRMNNLNASLGLGQIKKIQFILKKKRELSKKYKLNFKNNPYVDYVSEQKNTYCNYWINVIKLKDKYISSRNNILNYLNLRGYQSRPVWELLHTLPMYKNSNKSDLKNSIKLYKSTICIPSSPKLIISK